MEELIRDPEFAPQVFKLLNEQLIKTKQDLEASRQETEGLRAELARLRAEPPVTIDLTRDDDDQHWELERDLAEARKQNQELLAEIADFRALLEGSGEVETRETRVKEEAEVETLLCPRGCPTQELVGDLERQRDDLRNELNRQSAEYEQRVSDLQKHLEASTATLEDQRRQIDELREQQESSQKQFKEKEAHLQTELQLVTAKYQRYKAQFQDCYTSYELLKSGRQIPPPPPPGAPPAHSAVRPPQHSPVIPPANRPPPPAPPSASASPVARTVPAPNPASSSSLPPKPEPWFQIVNRTLSTPIFPLDNPNGPLRLPPNILRITSQESVLSIPDRLIYPFEEGAALLVAPRDHCKIVAGQVTIIDAPTHELQRLVGSRREVFYHSPDGICYAGTFLCTEVREMSADEYRALPKKAQDVIRLYTFPTKQKFFSTLPAQKEQIRQWFMCGEMKAESLLLRYTGFNKPLFDALQDLKAMERTKRASPYTTDDSGSAPQIKKIKRTVGYPPYRD